MSADQGRGGIFLATPGDWVTLRLPGGDAEVAAALAEHVRRHPQLAQRQELATEVLGTLGRAARAAGVVHASASFLDLPGGPLPATLLVSLAPPSVARGGVASAGEGDGRRNLAETECLLPAGRALRREWQQAGRLSDADAVVMSYVVQYFIWTPEEQGGGMVVLTFASPAVAVTHRLRSLFHAIATSVEVDLGHRDPRPA